MDELQREYDRFGPWTLELSEEDPAPRVFAPYLARREAPVLGLKIPRQVQRRDVRPGADLYHTVVALYEDELVVLRRSSGGVAVTSCAIAAIRYLRLRRSLLSGNVHVGLRSGPIDLSYNTVSDALMRRFVGLVRTRYVSGSVAPSAVPSAQMTTDGLSFYLQRFLEAEVRDRSPMRLLAAQATELAAVAARGRLRRLLFALADKRLLESIHTSDGRELRILSRGQAYAYRWENVFGLETTWIPLSNIRSAAWRPDPSSAAIALVIGTGADGDDCTFVFGAANPSIEAYVTWLRTLPNLCSDGDAPMRLAA